MWRLWFFNFILIPCTMHLLLFCTMTNKCTILSQNITLLHVSTLSCHPQGVCNQCLAKNLHKSYVKHLNYKLYYQQLRLKYLCTLAWHWLQTPWGWHDSVETCRSVIFCNITVHLLVTVQNIKITTQLFSILLPLLILHSTKTKLNSVALVRERTIPTERPPPVGEVSANFCG